MRLVELKYGTLKEVKELTAYEVTQVFYYQEFKDAYEEAYLELNK